MGQSPGPWEVPTLVITLPEFSSGQVVACHNQWLQGQTPKKNGSLSLLAADGQTELLRFNLFGLKPVKLSRSLRPNSAILFIAELKADRAELVL